MKTRRTKIPALFTTGLLLLAPAGCAARAPYYLVESRLVESRRLAGEPDVTETPAFRRLREDVKTVGLRPPDVCADRGLTSSGGEGELQLGVMRTRCGVEMAELERALARAGYQVVSWGAVQQMATSRDEPMLQAAKELSIDVLLQVNALERIDIVPGRDARWERRFYRATRDGDRADPAAVSPSRAEVFESLISSKEASLVSGKRIGATINVSAVSVDTGAAIWFYQWARIDDVSREPQVEVLVDCDDEICREVRRTQPPSSDDPMTGSIEGVSFAGDPADQGQAIFAELVRSLVTDLAERFAGQRAGPP